jgi:predicted phage-related endonuclease
MEKVENIDKYITKISCNICGTTFTAKSNLYRHKKNTCNPTENIRTINQNLLITIDELKTENKKYHDLQKAYEEQITEINNLKDSIIKLQDIEKDNIKLLSENEYLRKTIEDLEQFKISYMTMAEKSFETANKVIEINSETNKLQAETSIKSLSTVRYISKHMNQTALLKHERKEVVGMLE